MNTKNIEGVVNCVKRKSVITELFVKVTRLVKENLFIKVVEGEKYQMSKMAMLSRCRGDFRRLRRSKKGLIK